MNTSKIRKLPLILVLASVAGLLASCALDPEGPPRGPKFREEDSANLIIRYASDNTIYRLKPDGHEGAFYRLFTRDMVSAEAANTSGPRDLAVILIGYNQSLEIEHQIIENWKTALRDLHYRRVVFLRARDSQQVNGLRVITDELLTPGTASGQ